MPDQTFTIQTPGGTANPAASTVRIQTFQGTVIHSGRANYTTSPTTCAAGCPTSMGGNFFGAGAAFTSILFATDLPGGTHLNGAALGKR
jgi:hypothetical protein